MNIMQKKWEKYWNYIFYKVVSYPYMGKLYMCIQKMKMKKLLKKRIEKLKYRVILSLEVG